MKLDNNFRPDLCLFFFPSKQRLVDLACISLSLHLPRSYFLFIEYMFAQKCFIETASKDFCKLISFSPSFCMVNRIQILQF